MFMRTPQRVGRSDYLNDQVVRTTPDLDLRRGMQVPLLVDISHLFVFDQHGERICPSPDHLPDLDE